MDKTTQTEEPHPEEDLKKEVPTTGYITLSAEGLHIQSILNHEVAMTLAPANTLVLAEKIIELYGPDGEFAVETKEEAAAE